ncbi:MAG: hypothetical protein HKO66_12710 [Saprospiraceae bacterium]|nr:hypothetical protein [Bacteroidia bacterium]NNE16573.1 hypothetical protein [Saprospiraceae bacterium]NNL93092.1 hypothetical protein [Saprospiraceae bacterium]
MTSIKTQYLTDLINGLTKSEKRHFKLFSNRVGTSEKLYVQLFDLLSKDKVFIEKRVLEKIPEIKKSQLSNLKANLYKQLLRALRDINKEDYAEIKARELFDFAKVLYAKGQYQASIEMLEKVKNLAAKIHKQPLEYLAISFEKQIESQHVTGSMSPKAFVLSENSEKIINSLRVTDSLSNLSLSLYGIYLQRGYVRNEEDYNYLKSYVLEKLPEVELDTLDFYQLLHYYQIHVWYYHMIQDFPSYFKYSQKWVDLFDLFPEMKKPETTVYIKGLHNVLNALFMSGSLERFDSVLFKLSHLLEDSKYKLSRNELSQLELFKYTHVINRVYLTAEYDKDFTEITLLEKKINEEDHQWDLNRILVFNYKIACIYFGRGNLATTINYLNRITNFNYPNFKEDIQCFARILNLIAHFELGNDILVSYQIKSVYKFLLKMKELQKVQKEVLRFIRKTPSMMEKDLILEFKLLKKKLEEIETEPFEKRPFLYLDIISWLDSKINKTTMVKAIRKRLKSKGFKARPKSDLY